MSLPASLPLRLLSRPSLRWQAAVLGALLSLAVGWMSVGLLRDSARLEERNRAQQSLLGLRDRLDRELGNVLAMPETIAVFIAARGDIDGALLERVVARLQHINPHLRNVAIAPDNVIREVYPRAGNEKALGLNYPQVPSQWPAVAQAIRQRSTVVAGPFELAQGGRGIASRTPVFLAGGEGERYWGMVSMVVNADPLLQAVGFGEGREGFRFAARSGEGGQGPVFAGAAGVFEAEPVLTEYTLPGGGSWELAAVPAAGWGGLVQVPVLLYLLPLLAALALGSLCYAIVAAHQKALSLAMRDPVTGLANRRLLEDRLELAMLAARRYGRKGALLLIDLDRFKPVNDVHGHAAGDLVLTLVGQRLRGLARASDTVSRLGGDEFAVLLPEVGTTADAVAMAERVLTMISEPYALAPGAAVSVGACVGVAFFPQGAESPAQLMERADRALYRGKDSGRGQVCVDGCEQSLQVTGGAALPAPGRRADRPG